jgi:aldose 1-epimerase
MILLFLEWEKLTNFKPKIHSNNLQKAQKLQMEINITKFEDTEEVVLKNPINGESVSILPYLGAMVRNLTLLKAGKLFTILNCVGNLDELLTYKGCPSSLLFPWPNRTRNGNYSFQNHDYQLDISDKIYNNAIHGFIYNKPFVITDKSIENNQAKVSMVYNYDGSENGFPFQFDFTITYILHETEGFSMEVNISNIGNHDFPFGFGWHPYFEIENETIADWEILLPVKNMYMPDNQMISVGHGLYNYSNKWNQLANKSYDTVFGIEKNDGNKAITKLKSDKSNLTINVWQENAQNQFEFIVVYIPFTGKKIALEPMTCNTDALNNKEGLNVLPTGAHYKVKCGVYLT